MPIIAPPSDKTYEEEPQPQVSVSKMWERYRRIQLYLNVNNWKCIRCGSTVFGRTKICPYNRHGWYCRNPRPSDFKLQRTNA